MIRRLVPALATVGLLLVPLAGCSSSKADPGVTVTADTSIPDPAPSLGPDLACSDRQHCYLKNPRKLSDQEWRKALAAEGSGKTPAADMRPWAYVVLGLGQGRTEARDKPSKEAAVVGDEYGIVNHRALFAFCRTGGPAPADTWYLIEPIIGNAPEQVWMNGEYLQAYGHDGQIPTC